MKRVAFINFAMFLTALFLLGGCGGGGEPSDSKDAEIQSLIASKTNIVEGDEVTLSWKAINTQKCFLSSNPDPTNRGNSPVACDASQSVGNALEK